MEKLLSLEVKLLARAFHFLMFKKPLPNRINSGLTWWVYQEMNVAMHRHARAKAAA